MSKTDFTDLIKPRCDKRDFLSRGIARRCGRKVIHCRARYSVAIDAIIASGTARVLLNHGGIGMPYVRNSCQQAHNSATRREKNLSQSDPCDPRGGIAGWRGSAPRQLQYLVENQLNRFKRAAQRYRLPRRGTENRANRNGALYLLETDFIPLKISQLCCSCPIEQNRTKF